MTISGKIIQVLPAESVGQSSKSKQTFVLETEGQYPKKIAFDVWENKIELALGETVTVAVNIESREYNGKYFTNISGWKKEGASAPASAPQGATLHRTPDFMPAPALVSTPAPSPAPVAGGKLTISSAPFSAAVTKIEGMPNGPDKDAAIEAMEQKYELTKEQADTLEGLKLPF
jgi:hypothetical protein